MEKFIPIYFLYAEIHYKLFGVFNLLWHKFPEIIADVPFRVEPDTHIPVFCFIKDADLFPVILNRIDIELIYSDNSIEKLIFPFPALKVREKSWKKVFFVKPKEGFSGLLKINVCFSITSDNKEYYFKNDNYKKTTHCHFDVFIANENFPSFNDCIYGDLHFHSDLTSSIVEFGAPIDAAGKAASSIGLDFFVAADHSYCFENINYGQSFNYISDDKWETAKKNEAELNKQTSASNEKNVIIFQGEEVTCANSKNKNIHLILFNYDKFVHGSGDSAKDWFNNNPDNNLKDILDKIDKSALAFAAHPAVKYNFFEKLLFRRSKWTDADYLHKNLTGLQILNGVVDSSFFKGVKKWTEILLKGEKKFIAAGSDAHGNFNRFRQFGLPLINMKESKLNIFGNVRTGVFIDGDLTRENIIAGLKKGAYFITNGPAVKFTVKNEKNETAMPGESIKGKNLYLSFEIKSNSEFGKIKEINIFIGDLDSRKEFIYKTIKNLYEFSSKDEIKLFASSDNYYIRITASTKKKKKNYICFTNPIWVKS